MINNMATAKPKCEFFCELSIYFLVASFFMLITQNPTATYLAYLFVFASIATAAKAIHVNPSGSITTKAFIVIFLNVLLILFTF